MTMKGWVFSSPSSFHTLCGHRASLPGAVDLSAILCYNLLAMAFSDLHLHWMDRYTLPILLLLVAISLALEVIVHHMMGITVVYSHFFYVPVVLGAVWYGKRAVLVGLFLAAIYVGDYYLINGAISADVAGRALMFVAVALVIGLVMDSMRKEQEKAMTQMADAALNEGRRSGIYGNIDDLKGRLRSSGNVKRMTEEGDTRGLIMALRHRDSAVQYEAAEALGVSREPAAIPALIAALTGDRYSGVRWKAAEALARIGAPAVDPLIQALGHQDEDARWKAAIALGEIGDQRAIVPLISLLEDEDRFVQSRAAYALGQMGSPALPALIASLEGPSPHVRRGAALALGRIGDPGALFPLLAVLSDSDESVRAAAFEGLAGLGDEAYPRIIAHLRDSPPEDRTPALQALREVSDRKFLAGLSAHAEGADPETREVIISLVGGAKQGPGEQGS